MVRGDPVVCACVSLVRDPKGCYLVNQKFEFMIR
jgi:hypothetical protein